MRRAAVIVAGARRSFDVVDVPVAGGSAGIGLDATEVETLRGEIARTVAAHRRTLDQLPTAVAIFGADHKLAFYNAAYRTLWDLEPASSTNVRPTPPCSTACGRRAGCPSSRISGRGRRSCTRPTAPPSPRRSSGTCRTCARCASSPRPIPDGGVTYLFDDVTERLNLERRFDALIRVQRETLDNLSEARRGVRQRRPGAPVQPGVRDHVGLVAGRCSTSIRTSRR